VQQAMRSRAMTAPFRLADHHIDPAANEIDGHRIEAKAIEVLICLAQAAPAVVTRSELLDLVWPNVVVGDNVLHQAVTHLRKVLGDDARSPRYIENIPRRGYRLLVQVQGEASGGTEAQAAVADGMPDRIPPEPRRRRTWVIATVGVLAAVLLGIGWYAWIFPKTSAEPAAGAGPEHSIVVLPFVNLSPEADQEYFSDGLSEELINVLARNPELKVTSRTSAFHFKKREADLPTIARQLGVAHVLEGSVRKSGNQIRVTVQLVDARTDKHLWSETFDRALGDVFALQDEIAGRVFEKLRVTLLGPVAARRATGPDAYLRYLEAKRFLDLDNPHPNARALLEEAVAIDPGFVRGWTELARAAGRLGDHRASIAHTRTALALDPEDPIAHALLGWAKMSGQGESVDLVTSAAHFGRALAIDPTNVDVLRGMTLLLTRLGRFSDSIDVSSWLISRDPMCVICRMNLGQAYLAAGQVVEAQRVFSVAQALAPDSGSANAFLAWTQMLQGDARAALATVDGFGEAHPPLHPAFPYLRALALRQLGDTGILPSALLALESEWGAQAYYLLAEGYAIVGDYDATFSWLHRSADLPLGDMLYPHLKPAFAPLHDDPRWQLVLEKFGLLPEQLARIELHVVLPGDDA
jgi:TolB-like protein/DNA-binding winged helix-turn-helix (wHTH) protein/Flp pilus assembly protein TadD